MSQFDAKIVYIKGKENSVADALLCMPSPDTLKQADGTALHPYTFCEDDNNSSTVTSIIMPCLCGPWESATQLSLHTTVVSSICAALEITADKSFLTLVRNRYAKDAWCKTLPAAAISWPKLVFHNGLWYVRNRLIILRMDNLCETLFILAHNVLRHFGFYKTWLASECVLLAKHAA